MNKLSLVDRENIISYYQSWKQHGWRTAALVRTMAHNHNVSPKTIYRIIKDAENEYNNKTS